MANLVDLGVRITGDNRDLKNAMNESIGIVDRYGNKIQSSTTSAANATTKLESATRKATTATKQLAQAQVQAAATTDRLAKGIGASSLQFQGVSRILQDAAFGPAAIANNIEQAIGDFRTLNAVAKESGQSLGRTLVQSLRGGGGLNLALGGLTLALSLASFGMSAWTRLFPDAKKKVDDTKKSLDEYISTLETVRGALLKGQADGQKEITTLNLLYNAATNASLGTKERISASKQLQSQFKKDFGNYTTEQIMLGQAKDAYDRLSRSILASAQARAAANSITEKATDTLQKQSEITDLTSELNLADERLKRARQILAANIAAGQASITAEREVYNATEARNNIVSQINERAIQIAKNESESARLANTVNSLLSKGGTLADVMGVNVDKSNKKVKEQVDLWDQIRKTLLDIQKIDLPQYQNGGFERGRNLGTGRDVDPVQGYQALRNQMTADISRWSKSTGDVSSEWSKQMNFAVQRFGRDFLQTLTGINQLADRSFTSIFSTLASGFTTSFSELFLTQLTSNLKVSLKDSFNNLDLGGLGNKVSKAIVSGAGIAGSIISGITSPTSSVGQGLGGALSGAAAGTLIAPGVGTIIGGVVGAIGGLFGASRARKQEELQRQQLEEQKKQTALMERQNALAYASQIVGRMAAGIGIVNSADINAQGQVVLGTVSGEQIQLVLDRYNRNRK